MKTVLTYLRIPYLRRGVLAMILFGAGFAAIELGLRQPLTEEVRDADGILSSLQLDAAELRARVAAASGFDQMTSQLDQADARFNAQVDRSGVVERLTNLSAASGTRIIHGTNNFGRPRNGVVPVEQDLSIEGPYLAVSRFLGALGEIETLTLLRSAELTANSEGTLVRVKLKFVTLSGEAS